jgi:hypothetical protein
LFDENSITLQWITMHRFLISYAKKISKRIFLEYKIIIISFIPAQNHQKVCQKWGSNPRSQREPELKSGALDRSAILTCVNVDIKIQTKYTTILRHSCCWGIKMLFGLLFINILALFINYQENQNVVEKWSNEINEKNIDSIHLKSSKVCKIKISKSKKLFVRSGIWTHAHRSGLQPECSAFDHSAILTCVSEQINVVLKYFKNKRKGFLIIHAFFSEFVKIPENSTQVEWTSLIKKCLKYWFYCSHVLKIDLVILELEMVKKFKYLKPK